MPNSLLTGCQDCTELSNLLQKAECTLIQGMQERRNKEKFGVKTSYDPDTYNDLRRYHRILSKRTLNQDYPGKIDNQDIFTQVSKLLSPKPCCQCAVLNAVPVAVTTPVPSPTTTTPGENFIWTGNIL